MRHVTFVPAVALRYSVSMICRGRGPRQSHVGKEFAAAGKRESERVIQSIGLRKLIKMIRFGDKSGCHSHHKFK